MKISEYQTVVIMDDESSLDREVNKLIAEGWQPLGGVSITYMSDGTYKTEFAQAMVR